MSARTGGQIVVDALVSHGVTHAFGVPGESYLAALRFAHRHLHQQDTTIILTAIGWSLQRVAVQPIQDLIHRSNTSEAAARSSAGRPIASK